MKARLSGIGVRCFKVLVLVVDFRVWERGTPCFDVLVLNVQGGQGQKALIWKLDVSRQSGRLWGSGENRARTEERSTGVSALEEHMGRGGVGGGWSHENAWQIRMQSRSNYGYNYVCLEHALERHWRHNSVFTPTAPSGCCLHMETNNIAKFTYRATQPTKLWRDQ